MSEVVDDDSTAPPPPECPTCAALGPIVVDENAKLRVEVLTKYSQVIERLGDPRETDVTHAIWAAGLKVHYRIERPIRCGLPDRTNHQEGLIVETACGLTLNIGHRCGRKYIPGLEKLIEIRMRTEAYDLDMRAILTGPQEIRDEIARLTEAARRLDEARIAIADFASPVGRHMRAVAESGRGRDVVIETREPALEGRERVVERTRRLRGEQLWRARPDAYGLLRRLDAITVLIREASEVDVELNDVATALARKIRALKGELGPLRAWRRDATDFFLDENLAAVLYVTNLTAAQIDRGALVIRRDADGKLRRISAEGVEIIEPQATE